MVIHTNNNAYPQRGAWDSCRYCTYYATMQNYCPIWLYSSSFVFK